MEEDAAKRRRGIYLLPNLFTTAGLFAGFYAIVAAMGNRFEAAAVAIFVAMVMDGIDGRFARLTHTESDFGGQYDSLADMISFGLAPALVVYEWALASLGKVGWLAAFVFTAGAALRLARFNTQVGARDKRYFQGLASPSAAATLAGLVWVCDDLGFAGWDVALVAFAFTVATGVLMVSNIPYRSFKDLDVKGRVPFVAILMVVVVFVFISLKPPLVLFATATVYGLSGPALALVRWRRRAIGRGRGSPDEGGENDGPD